METAGGVAVLFGFGLALALFISFATVGSDGFGGRDAFGDYAVTDYGRSFDKLLDHLLDSQATEPDTDSSGQASTLLDMSGTGASGPAAVPVPGDDDGDARMEEPPPPPPPSPPADPLEENDPWAKKANFDGANSGVRGGGGAVGASTASASASGASAAPTSTASASAASGPKLDLTSATPDTRAQLELREAMARAADSAASLPALSEDLGPLAAAGDRGATVSDLVLFFTKLEAWNNQKFYTQLNMQQTGLQSLAKRVDSNHDEVRSAIREIENSNAEREMQADAKLQEQVAAMYAKTILLEGQVCALQDRPTQPSAAASSGDRPVQAAATSSAFTPSWVYLAGWCRYGDEANLISEARCRKLIKDLQSYLAPADRHFLDASRCRFGRIKNARIAISIASRGEGFQLSGKCRPGPRRRGQRAAGHGAGGGRPRAQLRAPSTGPRDARARGGHGHGHRAQG